MPDTAATAVHPSTTDAHRRTHTPAVFSTTGRKVVAYFPSLFLLGIPNIKIHPGGKRICTDIALTTLAKNTFNRVLFSFFKTSQMIYQGSLSSTEGTSDKHLETDGVILA